MDDSRGFIGLEIKKIRKSKHISQEKLAEMSEVHPTYIGQIERGEKNITVDVLIRILSSMNVRLADFFSVIDAYLQIAETKEGDYALKLLQMDSSYLEALLKIAGIIRDLENNSDRSE